MGDRNFKKEEQLRVIESELWTAMLVASEANRPQIYPLQESWEEIDGYLKLFVESNNDYLLDLMSFMLAQQNAYFIHTPNEGDYGMNFKLEMLGTEVPQCALDLHKI